MRPTLSNCDALDGSTANHARVTSALVNAEVLLKITSTVDPIDTGSLAMDAILKYLANAGPQTFGLFTGNGVGDHQGMQSRQMESFISVDISQPGDEGLVEQQGF